MAYTRATRLPDRYKVVFRNAAGARIRVFLTQTEFDRKDRDQYILNAYAPTGRDWQTYDYWFVPYIETFDTPSGGLEPGMIWEGLRERTDPTTKQRQPVPVVQWCDTLGEFNESKPEDLVVTRTGETIETVTRKTR